MRRRTATRTVLLLAASLLALAGAARSQEAPRPWEADPIDPTALTKELDRVKQHLEGMRAESPDIADLRARLEDPTLSAEEIPDWIVALELRRQLLDELQQVLADRKELRKPEKIEEIRNDAKKQLDAIQALPPPALATTPFAEGDMARYTAELGQADDALKQAVETRDAREKQIADAQEAIRTAIPQRRARAQQALAEDDTGATGRLGEIVRENAALELRVVGEKETLLRDGLETDRWPKLLLAREDQVEAARLLQERARRVVELAKPEEKALNERKAREAADRAEQAAARAEENEKNAPIVAYEERKNAKREEVNSAISREKNRRDELKEAAEREQQRNDRLREEYEQLRQRVEIGASSRQTADLLRLTWKRVRGSLQDLRRNRIPAHDEAYQSLMLARADVQDRVWELDRTTENAHDEWNDLAEKVPEDRVDEARVVFDRTRRDLQRAHEARRQQIDEMIGFQGRIGDAYLKRVDLYEEIYAFVVQRIYWVRTEAPIGVATVLALPGEIAKLGETYGGGELRSGVARSYVASPTRFVLGASGVLLLVALGGVIAWKLRRYSRRFRYRGATLLVFLQRLGVSLLFSLLGPLCLLAAVPLMRLAELPDALAIPGERLLLGLGAILFARRFLWTFFREEGIAITELRAPPEVATQLLSASMRATSLAACLFLPWLLLRSDPLGLEQAPRILRALLLLAGALLLIRLLRRRGPLMQALLAKHGFWSRAWLVLHLIVSLGLLTIVAMDVLGYRLGSELLAKNVIQTFAATLVLVGAYNLLTRLVEGAARSALRRHRAEGADPEEIERSRKRIHQLTGFAGVVLLVVAVVLLAQFWGIDSQLRSFGRAIVLATVDAEAGTVLTLWDVWRALLFIVAGHFLVRNLAGLLEVAIYPAMEGSDAGSRFAVQTIFRYLILLVAYGAALLSLRISFASLGVVLAAASLGIGFGLQEIISNFISGLILLLERPVRVGDIINVGDTSGTVKEINIRATVIENWDRQLMIVPNRKFITENVINWTRNDDVMRSTIEVGVAYGSDVEQVLRVLSEETCRHRNVLDDPEVRVLFMRFGDSSLEFRVAYFTRIVDRLPTASEVQGRIVRRFEAEGIVIPFPQRDVWMRTAPRAPEPPPGTGPEDGGAAPAVAPGPEPA